MALRWRIEGNLVCAAKSEERPGDTYINDRLHYHMSEILQVIEPTVEEAQTGLWKWREVWIEGAHYDKMPAGCVDQSGERSHKSGLNGDNP